MKVCDINLCLTQLHYTCMYIYIKYVLMCLHRYLEYITF